MSKRTIGIIKRDPMGRGWFIIVDSILDHLYNDGQVRRSATCKPDPGVSAFWSTRDDAVKFFNDWAEEKKLLTACVWKPSEDPLEIVSKKEFDQWSTGCSADWITIGRPDNNDMHFCPVCGRKIVVEYDEG